MSVLIIYEVHSSLECKQNSSCKYKQYEVDLHRTAAQKKMLVTYSVLSCLADQTAIFAVYFQISLCSKLGQDCGIHIHVSTTFIF